MKTMTFSKARLSLFITLSLILGMALGPVLVEAQSNTIVAAAAGTITTDNPLSGAQTWNAGGVSFHGLLLTFTETASAAGSQYIQILGGAAGTTQEFAINKGGALALGATTNQAILGVTNTTTINAAAPASSITLNIPNQGSAAMPYAIDCGSTGSGNQTCTNASATAGTYHVISGRSTLSGSAAVITFPTGFGYVSGTSYECVANDVTTRANPVQMVTTSATTATITNTTGATDVIQWICSGL